MQCVCSFCNNAKQDRVKGTDPETGRSVRLFHPRKQRWGKHFAWGEGGGSVIGKAVTGRATVAALRMNHPRVVLIRLLWARLGLHPPKGPEA